MRFKKLKLYTSQLESEFAFYSETLGFEIITSSKNSFTVKMGWTELTFEKSEKDYHYHYCFLIPSNKLYEALEWMEQRVDIIHLENGRKTQNFETWNADSFYFYDASGNLAECIARFDLANEDHRDFDRSKVIGVNEIGMPTKDIKRINNQLENELGTKFWKGDLDRFGTNGNQEGILLLPNYNIKQTWFPTGLKTKAEPLKVLIEYNENFYLVDYQNEQLKITNK
ncbi:glyoxalase [Flavobacteriaceae sp. LMIT009]